MDIDMKDVAVREDAHCVFNVNSYQMVFVANSESVLYKRHAFSRAKQVTNRFPMLCIFFDILKITRNNLYFIR